MCCNRYCLSPDDWVLAKFHKLFFFFLMCVFSDKHTVAGSVVHILCYLINILSALLTRLEGKKRKLIVYVKMMLEGIKLVQLIYLPHFSVGNHIVSYLHSTSLLCWAISLYLCL